MTSKLTKKIIRDHVKLDDDMHRLITLAIYDLMFGPIGPLDDDGDPWPGFSMACDAITSALSSVSDLWIDLDGDFAYDTEPAWCEGCDNEDCKGQNPESWVHYERASVIKVLVGSELAGYVS